MNIFTKAGQVIKETVSLNGYLDKEKAAENIRNNVQFRGPNAWILAFSTIIASIGLNVNSIPVIIGAMLISPLMGPIFGIGFSLGTNDVAQLKRAARNFLRMMLIALGASFIYFLLTPLSLNNPTEILARTNPTIYDVLIALFGGAAGMFEQCRKEKGTVFSGVAIATALMPPLCTAGFGIASMDLHIFLGALYLFLINCVFIALATYLMAKILDFEPVAYEDAKKERKIKWLTGVIMLIFIIPSVWSAVNLIRDTEFDSRAVAFVNENKTMDGAIIYDYSISHEDGYKLELFISGERMDEQHISELLDAAKRFGISEDQLVIRDHFTSERGVASDIIKGIYARSDEELAKKDAEIESLKKEMEAVQQKEVPYTQITKEIANIFPTIESVNISAGKSVTTDSLKVTNSLMVIAKSSQPMTFGDQEKLLKWLKIRLDNDSVELQVKDR
ncbi:MAG: TIGR00341 family protein [Bacteroidales bacterium]|nr:TIGR00341 family protein [Bacteroidales bacterium]